MKNPKISPARVMRDKGAGMQYCELLLRFDMKRPISRKGRKADNEKRVKKIDGKLKFRVLDEYDMRNYARDLEYLARLSFLKESTRDWIENRMYELRDGSNRYEQFMGQLLMKKGIDFIHQAPFVFRPHNIYFCDFYLPQYRMVVEVDGVYHQGNLQFSKDAERDANFRSVGILVFRVNNSETLDTKRLSIRLDDFIAKYRSETKN